MHYKSLWKKASAKCVNVNIFVINIYIYIYKVFVFLSILYIYIYNWQKNKNLFSSNIVEITTAFEETALLGLGSICTIIAQSPAS